MKRALLYLRVSTSKQDIDGYSIPLQKERLISYCKAKDYIVAGVYVDAGYSGANTNRPGLTNLIGAVEAKKGDVVLVMKMDRLSRSQRDMMALLEDVFEPNGVSFVSMQESFDTGTVYGKAMLGILSVFSQMERSVIVERTMMGRQGRAQEGYFHGGGTEPIGYDYIDGELVINEEEAKQVRRVYRFYSMGYSVTEISRRMEGYKTKHGDWSHTSTIGNVLDNPLYAGKIHFDGVLSFGKHDPIVPLDIDSKVKARRERLRVLEAAGDSNFLLTGIIYCQNCGARYFPNKRPNGKVVYSCHSRAKKNKKMVKDPTCKAPHIPIEELDTIIKKEVLRLAKNPKLVDEIIKKRAAKGSSNSDSKSEEIKQYDREISRLMDSLSHDALESVGEIAAQIAELHAEKMKLVSLRDYVPRHYNVEAAKMLLSDIRYGWSKLDNRGRRSFLFQLIDKIQINTEEISISWSFE